jgi:hypothetical protein
VDNSKALRSQSGFEVLKELMIVETTYSLYMYEYNELPNVEDNERMSVRLQVNKESYE